MPSAKLNHDLQSYWILLKELKKNQEIHQNKQVANLIVELMKKTIVDPKKELIPISRHHVQKLLVFCAVYGLRWKFMQIQTQQVRNFRIFSAIHTRPPILRNKIRHPSIVKRIIPFFASLGKKNCACHYYKAAKKIFEISMETLLFLKNFRKKRKLNYFCPNTQLAVLYSLSLYLLKKKL